MNGMCEVIKEHFDKGYNKCSVYSGNENDIKAAVNLLENSGYETTYVKNGMSDNHWCIKRVFNKARE